MTDEERFASIPEQELMSLVSVPTKWCQAVRINPGTPDWRQLFCMSFSSDLVCVGFSVGLFAG